MTEPRIHKGWIEPHDDYDEAVEEEYPRMLGESDDMYRERLDRIAEYTARSEIARFTSEIGESSPRHDPETGLLILPDDDSGDY